MPKKRENLSTEAKVFIVQRLACFDAPSVVQQAIKTEMGITVAPQHIEMYDPHKVAGKKLAERWKNLFETTRDTFLKDATQIGVSHKVVRLRALQRLMERAEKSGNIALTAQLLEQIAKECGNVFTNRAEITGKDGGPVQTEAVQFYLPDNGRE